MTQESLDVVIQIISEVTLFFNILQEKDLIHKLFKVLVPRYEDHKSSYTAYHKLPFPYPRDMNRGGEALLELKSKEFIIYVWAYRGRNLECAGIYNSRTRVT